MAIAFVIGMFCMFVVFSVFFVSMMYTYKDNRLKNIPIGYHEDGVPDKSGTDMILGWDSWCIWLLLPISTVGLFFFLKKNVIKSKLN
jgi:Na+/H+ antiporter NhaC